MAPQRTALREGCFGEVVFEANNTSTDTHAAACKSRAHMTWRATKVQFLTRRMSRQHIMSKEIITS